MRTVIFFIAMSCAQAVHPECTVSRWSENSGSAIAETQAKYFGNCGLETIADGNPAYVEDQTPGMVEPPVPDYAARFYVDLEHLGLPDSVADVTLFSAMDQDGAEAFAVVYGTNSDYPVVFARAAKERTADISLPAGWQEITVFWSNSGVLRLRVGDIGDNSVTIPATEQTIDKVRLGLIEGNLWQPSGSVYYDEFSSTRGTDPGPVIAIPADSNLPPVADAGADQTVRDDDGDGTEIVVLDATGSTDADGAISKYKWSENGRQLALRKEPDIPLDIGKHELILTVTDDKGAMDTDSVNITVLKKRNSIFPLFPWE